MEERFLSSTNTGPPPGFNATQVKILNPVNTESEKLTKAQKSSIECPFNETINECGKVCEVDCLSIFEREECTACGSPSCACNQGFARHNGTCIYWGDCSNKGRKYSNNKYF